MPRLPATGLLGRSLPRSTFGSTTNCWRAAAEAELLERELRLLREVLQTRPAVVHLQSGHGLDDVALTKAGARHVVGVDYSVTAATAAQRRAIQLETSCRYVVAEVPGCPCGMDAPSWFTPAKAR